MKITQGTPQEIPVSFLNKMAGLLGDEYDQFFSCLQLPPTDGLRVNLLKTTPYAFIRISPYKLSPVSWCSSGFVIDDELSESRLTPPGKHPHHNAGLYYLQEPSSMAAGEVLSPLPGERILDLAAAPGGKATHLAGLMQNTGLLVANEIHPRRVWDLAENLERCGVTNAVVTNETPQRLAEHFGVYFDRVMLDAPCSGEGMFRKSIAARKEWKPEMVQSCAFRQLAILEQAARMVKPGGCLAYTTCTFSPEEDEGVIASFLEKHTNFELKAAEPLSGCQPARPEWIGFPREHKLTQAIRIWPHKAIGEGHFIALLVKNRSTRKGYHNHSASQIDLHRKLISSRKLHVVMNLLDKFAGENLKITFEEQLIDVSGSYIYQLPIEAPDTTGLKVIHPGWWLGTIHNDHFTPSHGLAMGILSDHAMQVLGLQPDDQHLSAYLTGESFTNIGGNGWVLVTVDGFPLGWGKRVQNVIKNYYPHGLRRL